MAEAATPHEATQCMAVTPTEARGGPRQPTEGRRAKLFQCAAGCTAFYGRNGGRCCGRCGPAGASCARTQALPAAPLAGRGRGGRSVASAHSAPVSATWRPLQSQSDSTLTLAPSPGRNCSGRRWFESLLLSYGLPARRYLPLCAATGLRPPALVGQLGPVEWRRLPRGGEEWSL